jgi:hypothetical protein
MLHPERDFRRSGGLFKIPLGTQTILPTELLTARDGACGVVAGKCKTQGTAKLVPGDTQASRRG